MAGTVGDRVLDAGLTTLIAEARDVWINTSPEPTTYAAATSGATALGTKDWNVGGVFSTGSPVAGAPNGRKVTTKPITDGLINTSGTAASVSIVDRANSRLLVTTTLSATQAVTATNPFTLTAFDVRLPGA